MEREEIWKSLKSTMTPLEVLSFPWWSHICCSNSTFLTVLILLWLPSEPPSQGYALVLALPSYSTPKSPPRLKMVESLGNASISFIFIQSPSPLAITTRMKLAMSSCLALPFHVFHHFRTSWCSFGFLTPLVGLRDCCLS